MNERPSILNMTVPDFAAEMTGGHAFRLSEHRGKKVILYFYPKDNTPGCTARACNFVISMRALPVLAPKSSVLVATACARTRASRANSDCHSN